MVALGKKEKATLVLFVLLVFFTLLLAVLASAFKAPPHPGEGYVDPASGIHITPSGDITGFAANSSSIIKRDGNVYTLTGNTTSMVTIDKNNIVFDGAGFSLTGPHGLRLTGVSNVTVKNLNIQTHYLYILLDHTQNSVVQNVISSFRIQLSYSSNNLVSNCTGNVELENSSNNIIERSVIWEVILSRSNGNSLLFNTISAQGPSLGIWQSSNNLIFGNNFEKFWWWISMTEGSTNNKVVANNVWAGQIYLEDKLVGTNYIYHNNFWNFKWNQSATTNSANVWSSDMRGNYWANFHTGDSNHDGIVDSPFVIDRTNKDQYPLTTPVDLSAEQIPS